MVGIDMMDSRGQKRSSIDTDSDVDARVTRSRISVNNASGSSSSSSSASASLGSSPSSSPLPSSSSSSSSTPAPTATQQLAPPNKDNALKPSVETTTSIKNPYLKYKTKLESITKRVCKQNGWKDTHAIDLAQELFRGLCCKAKVAPEDASLSLPPRLDIAWHAFIIETKDYLAFCNDVCNGTFLHHSTATSTDPVAVKNQRVVTTQLIYQMLYGKNPRGEWCWELEDQINKVHQDQQNNQVNKECKVIKQVEIRTQVVEKPSDTAEPNLQNSTPPNDRSFTIKVNGFNKEIVLRVNPQTTGQKVYVAVSSRFGWREGSFDIFYRGKQVAPLETLEKNMMAPDVERSFPMEGSKDPLSSGAKMKRSRSPQSSEDDTPSATSLTASNDDSDVVTDSDQSQDDSEYDSFDDLENVKSRNSSTDIFPILFRLYHLLDTELDVSKRTHRRTQQSRIMTQTMKIENSYDQTQDPYIPPTPPSEPIDQGTQTGEGIAKPPLPINRYYKHYKPYRQILERLSRLACRQNNWLGKYTPHLARELFTALCAKSFPADDERCVPAYRLEAVWGLFVQDTKSYAKFCDEILAPTRHRIDHITIYVKNLFRNKVMYQLGTDEMVDDSMRLLEFTEGIPISQQILVFACKQLEMGKCVRDYNILGQSTVILTRRNVRPG
ncbi:hypothetical protein HDU76_004492 [Blyttiomyces sp. JEL0837]|nr:hypothetical protein HDU76_004492 [Blyttiomyces sp. JEL0837]